MKRTRVSLQTWIALLTIVISIVLVYQLFIAKPTVSQSAKSLIPDIACANGGKPGKLGNRYQPGRSFIIYYNTKSGCNRIDGQAANSLGSVLTNYHKKIIDFGIQPASEPIAIALVGEAPSSLRTVYRVGRPGAMVLSSKAQGLLPAQGYIELSLQQNVPGLSTQATQRVALALAALSVGDKTSLSFVENQLYNGSGYRGDEGLYDAWLVARYGPLVMRKALDQCRLSCNYSLQLRKQIEAQGKKPLQLERLFSARATGSQEIRTALLSRMRAK
jgi:hypothetical protein